ncbi:unnamed protein product [Vitrella brassicaformis CCMP3155]|uniref:Folate receptor-like domain-containing protein n=1 Tax=Vitrella brassicaformis (strain CCMP3155) TaxID=1169540 RepID=A0A0G4GRQ8_VITBC|nr:unnamed protein product [Vitrella brassicaformis CCMP3155]|eukprot:CEM33039.1 unnamed protein product [Vitrella brassicaformis CCMP3155]
MKIVVLACLLSVAAYAQGDPITFSDEELSRAVSNTRLFLRGLREALQVSELRRLETPLSDLRWLKAPGCPPNRGQPNCCDAFTRMEELFDDQTMPEGCTDAFELNSTTLDETKLVNVCGTDGCVDELQEAIYNKTRKRGAGCAFYRSVRRQYDAICKKDANDNYCWPDLDYHIELITRSLKGEAVINDTNLDDLYARGSCFYSNLRFVKKRLTAEWIAKNWLSNIRAMNFFLPQLAVKIGTTYCWPKAVEILARGPEGMQEWLKKKVNQMWTEPEDFCSEACNPYMLRIVATFGWLAVSPTDIDDLDDPDDFVGEPSGDSLWETLSPEGRKFAGVARTTRFTCMKNVNGTYCGKAIREGGDLGADDDDVTFPTEAASEAPVSTTGAAPVDGMSSSTEDITQGEISTSTEEIFQGVKSTTEDVSSESPDPDDDMSSTTDFPSPSPSPSGGRLLEALYDEWAADDPALRSLLRVERGELWDWLRRVANASEYCMDIRQMVDDYGCCGAAFFEWKADMLRIGAIDGDETPAARRREARYIKTQLAVAPAICNRRLDRTCAAGRALKRLKRLKAVAKIAGFNCAQARAKQEKFDDFISKLEEQLMALGLAETDSDISITICDYNPDHELVDLGTGKKPPPTTAPPAGGGVPLSPPNRLLSEGTDIEISVEGSDDLADNTEVAIQQLYESGDLAEAIEAAAEGNDIFDGVPELLQLEATTETETPPEAGEGGEENGNGNGNGGDNGAALMTAAPVPMISVLCIAAMSAWM